MAFSRRERVSQPTVVRESFQSEMDVQGVGDDQIARSVAGGRRDTDELHQADIGDVALLQREGPQRRIDGIHRSGRLLGGHCRTDKEHGKQGHYRLAREICYYILHCSNHYDSGMNIPSQSFS